MLFIKTLEWVNGKLDFLSDKLLSLPKSIFRTVVTLIVTVALAALFFIMRDVLHFFGRIKDRIFN